MRIELAPDGRSGRLIEPYLNKYYQLEIPEGFRTDFASVPRMFWSILPPTGTYLRAAVMHDYVYKEKNVVMSRKMADRMFRSEMKTDGVQLWRRTLMYMMVRLFGRKAWAER